MESSMQQMSNPGRGSQMRVAERGGAKGCATEGN